MRDIDDSELLQRTYALAVENNKLLKRMRRAAWFSFIYKIAFWGVIIYLTYMAYATFVDPIITQAQSALSQVQGVAQKAQEATDRANALSEQAGAQVQEVGNIMDSIPGLDLLQQWSQ